MPADGPGAPPRDNGELVFAAPWESRAFGMAVSLCESGAVHWEPFQAALIARLADPGAGRADDYYRCWLGALEEVLSSTGTVSPGELDSRARQLTGRRSGHDQR